VTVADDEAETGEANEAGDEAQQLRADPAAGEPVDPADEPGDDDQAHFDSTPEQSEGPFPESVGPAEE
jgi:hypothetical protein